MGRWIRRETIAIACQRKEDINTIDFRSSESPVKHTSIPCLFFLLVHLETIFPECFGCKSPINDSSFLSVTPGTHWHDDCLRCRLCKQKLDERTTCFMDRHGFPYCKHDYPRLALVHHLEFSLKVNRLIPFP